MDRDLDPMRVAPTKTGENAGTGDVFGFHDFGEGLGVPPSVLANHQ